MHFTNTWKNHKIMLKEQYDNKRRTSKREENETGNGSGDCDQDEEEN